MELRAIFLLPVVYLLVPVVLSVFDQEIDGPDGVMFFFDQRRNHLQAYDVPSGNLRRYLRVPAYDVAYWPKEGSMLYTYNGAEIRTFNVWGDLNDSLLIDRDTLGDNEYWVYIRLEIRENWLLAGAIDVVTSRIQLYRVRVHDDRSLSSIALLGSESVTASKNIIIQPTMSPETRYVYAVSDQGIFRLSYDGGPSELIIEDQYAVNPSVIVTERRLYFVTGESRNIIRSTDLEGGNVTTLYTSSFRMGGAGQYGDWLIVSEENEQKEYQFLHLKTNETRTILNEPYDGSSYLVGRLDFWAVGEVYKTHSLLNPATIRARSARKVTMTTTVSSAGNVPYQYLSSFDRLTSTGTGMTLPAFAQYRYPGIAPAQLVLSRNNMRSNDRTGVFVQKVFTPLGEEKRIVIVVQSPGELTFPKPTITVNIADNVTLSVPKPTQRNLRWRHNGQVVPQWSNLRQITISNVTQDDEGIYECYLFKRRSLGGHAIMRLIVRGCPVGYCSPPDCTLECPVCYNGGIPRDPDVHSGNSSCICAPGFMGPNCEEATGVGRYGQEGELWCPEGDCREVLICQVDPYGCSCAAGYKGPGCYTECEVGTFVAYCEVECHCVDTSLCDVMTGSGDSAGGCQTNWAGPTCQLFTAGSTS
ncbi:uncharacterized protein [Apostichopus japonicus]|uniref:uncharacterized protein isoform X2 n=1 Tax=Stichopus japonicus TaxID=307972 RepID=UPI003AB48543